MSEPHPQPASQTGMTTAESKPIAVTGGGSAGHVIPALPVADALLARGHTVHFIGTRSGLEQGYLGDRPITFHGISAGKLRRYFSVQNFTDLFRIAWAVAESFLLLRRIRPSVLFSKGGFVSLPPVFAAWLLGIPVVAHESDLTPGLANRLSLPFIKTLCTSFSGTRFSGFFSEFTGRQVVTGTPVRDSLLTGNAALARERYGIDANQAVLLVTGGSLGAEGLNRIIRDNLDALTERFFVVHVCGVGKTFNVSQPCYIQLEFVDDGWGDLLACADLVVSRAGANALFEWLALGKPNLLVPLPAGGSRGDQLANAEHALARGWSEVVEEDDLTGERLLAALSSLSQHSETYIAAMAEHGAADAVSQLVAEILSLSSA